jgi:hypothetical protein
VQFWICGMRNKWLSCKQPPRMRKLPRSGDRVWIGFKQLVRPKKCILMYVWHGQSYSTLMTFSYVNFFMFLGIFYLEYFLQLAGTCFLFSCNYFIFKLFHWNFCPNVDILMLELFLILLFIFIYIFLILSFLHLLTCIYIVWVTYSPPTPHFQAESILLSCSLILLKRKQQTSLLLPGPFP